MNRHKVYRCLEEGQSLSSKQLMELTDLDLRVVQDTLAALRDRKFVVPSPVLYTLTDAGMQAAQRAKERREREARPLMMAKAGMVANSVFNWR